MSAVHELIANRYQVLQVVAEGGMGRVLRVRDAHLGRTLALKVLLRPDDEALRLRFVREAQISGLLDHPHVVPVHELGLDGDRLYLVMKWVEGQELAGVVKALGRGDAATCERFGLPSLMRLFLQVCEAISFAHARGVIHRDLKPANILLGEDGEVLVMDWGLAKRLGEDDDPSPAATASSRVDDSGLTQAGAIMGTPGYMPPEQAGGEPLDARADVYALGAVLYELLTLKRTFSGNAHEVLMKVFRGPPQPPREAAPEREIPAQLEAIAVKALSMDPDDRYANAASLAQDVQAYIDGELVSAYTEVWSETAQRLLRRHKLAVGVGLAGCLVLIVALLGGRTLVTERERKIETRVTQAREAATTAAAAQSASQLAAEHALRVAAGSEARAEGERLAGDFERRARAALRTPRLLELHATTRAALAEGSPTSSRRRIDLAFARVLVARAPAQALAALPDLDLGHEGPLLNGRALVRLERWDEASAALKADWPPGRDDLRLAAAALQARLRWAPLAEQQTALDAAIKANPLAEWLRWRRAECLALQGRFVDAFAGYDKAYALYPLDMFGIASRLRHATPICEDRTILSTYTAVAELIMEFPGDMSARAALLAYGWATGQWEEYEAEINSFLEHCKDFSPLQAQRALAEGSLVFGALARAERHAREACALDVDDVEALGLLAECLARGDELTEATELARRGLERFAEHGRLNRALGTVYVRQGQDDLALPHLRLAARPSLEPGPWVALAECLLRLGSPEQLEEGVTAARRAVACDPYWSWQAPTAYARPVPGDPTPHRVLGALRTAQGKLGAAMLHHARAHQLATSVERHVKRFGVSLVDLIPLGQLSERLGLPKEAKRFYERARRDPAVEAEAEALLQQLRQR